LQLDPTALSLLDRPCVPLFLVLVELLLEYESSMPLRTERGRALLMREEGQISDPAGTPSPPGLRSLSRVKRIWRREYSRISVRRFADTLSLLVAPGLFSLCNEDVMTL